MSIIKPSYESYDAMISNPSWKNKLMQLNCRLRDALRDEKRPETLSGNLFYDHLQPNFWNSDLIDGCDKKRRRLFSLAKNATSYFEVGVNGGHSMFLALSANPDLKCVGVDLCTCMHHDWGAVDIYVEVAIDWLIENFPDQITFLKGDSTEQISPFVQANKELTFDLVHLDGAKHTYLTDAKNIWPLLHKETRIIFDDTNNARVDAMVKSLLASGYAIADPNYPEITNEMYQNSIVKVAKYLEE